MSRKAQKRQSLIVSLSDHNQEELRKIQRQKEELIKDHEEKKAGLFTEYMYTCTRTFVCMCSLQQLFVSCTDEI